MHRGHAFSALTAHDAARRAGGRFLLRMEDIDATRCRPEFEAAILEDLAWLGLTWDGPVLRQSEHLDDYHGALDRLIRLGCAYRCFRTRRELAEEMTRAPHGPPESWRGAPSPPEEEARRLREGEPYAWRLWAAAAQARLGPQLTFLEIGGRERPVDLDAVGDVVLARKDVGVAYHLAVVVDDARQGVTHVIRGEDLASAVPVQRVLQDLLDLPVPVYRHHRLLTGPDGKRFAKRDRAETLADLRRRGVTPEALRTELGFD